MHTPIQTHEGLGLGASLPRGCLLSGGGYQVLVTAAGTGASWLDGTALTSWTGDPVEDRDGFFFFLRDLDGGVFWSLGRQPVDRTPDRYDAGWRPGRFEIARLDFEIEARMEVTVAGEGPLEIRRVALTNHSSRRRRIEVTSYAEVVLQPAAAHAAHPEYSRLFVQTEYVADAAALLARRRPRSPDERHPWLWHSVVEGGALEFETDRCRFIGRGRGLGSPRALAGAGPLAGASGNVLDPIVALRRVVELEPGGSACLTFLLGAAAGREEALAGVERWTSARLVDEAFVRAQSREREALARLGLGEERAAEYQALAAALLYGRAGLGAAAPPPAESGVWGGLAALEAAAQMLAAAEQVAMPVIERARADVSGAESDGALRGPNGAGAGEPPHADLFAEPLRHFNGFGGFSQDGREYVVRIEHRAGEAQRLPPRPWANVIANEQFGCVVSETGAGVTWSQNSREHRITPWSNDALLDPHGEALYLRDEDSGDVWSPLPGPRPAKAAYEMRHGFGASTCRHHSHELAQETCVFVTRHDPVKVVRLRITNSGPARRLSLYAYHRLVLGVLPEQSGRAIVTEWEPAERVALARNPAAEGFERRVAFAAAVTPEGAVVRHTCDRASFIGVGGAGGAGGPSGSARNPAAPLAGGPLDARDGSGLDPCFALQVALAIPAGATVECSILLGEGADRDDALALLRRHREPRAIAMALEEVRAFWDEQVSRVQIETPAPALDLMVNGWLAYQALSCRIWGRTALYQSGGAFGFRDQLQDAAALAWHDPGLTRAQILLNAEHQFVEGDVLHWWHPPVGRGIRTRFADDLLWLPYVTAGYVRATGDAAILDESRRFLTAPPLAPGEDEVYLLPTDAGSAADLYEHCCRALDRSLGVGANGLPLFGTGDWNDGMNRVGRLGRGESVWMAFFLYTVLGDFLPLCERRDDAARAARYGEHRERLRAAVEGFAWDGAWYLRGTYDDGTRLGSSQGDECRIDALAQAWSVISKAASPERARMAMDSVERHLVSEADGIVRLLTPPFEHTPNDPGYIKGYLPGVRENGGQYTHAALWVVRALAELGRNDRAARLLEMLSPVHQTRSPEQVARYQVEPFVVAADVYGAEPHVGRGGWTWYTGSAGWMLRVALESILGLGIEGGKTLVVHPCIPADWPRCRATLRIPGAASVYDIQLIQPHGGAGRVVEARVDGAPAPVVDGAARIPIAPDGTHKVEVVLG